MMRRLGLPAVLSLLLAVVIHTDWHLARSAHHRLSLGWSQHWIFAMVGFAVIGWAIGRLAENPITVGAAVLALGVGLAQAAEPVVEVAIYQGRFGYPDEPQRWLVFALCLAVGLPAFVAALVLCRPRGGATQEDRLSVRTPDVVQPTAHV